ncbi:DUF2809 domain-containing protein [Clostridium bovifaecis]|uniref:DUF2809 domain-containing protein n=1 Tax=Clostridium bovifaecis TaxID=2184719 RepID=A0A6I6EZ63_9CLOT|nr:DUF2809 domain-containing protein [Clostridium bovifaecis]
MNDERNRLLYGLLIIIVMLIGISTRKYPMLFPMWFAKYAGDTLWALMIFLCMGFVFNKWSIKKIVEAALAFSFLVEISQLYHKPWIDNVRLTRLGSLILGYGFLWSDLVCYIVGIIIGALLEIVLGMIRINLHV